MRGGGVHPADDLAQRGAEAGTDPSWGRPKRAGKAPCGDFGTRRRARAGCRERGTTTRPERFAQLCRDPARTAAPALRFLLDAGSLASASSAAMASTLGGQVGGRQRLI